MSNKNKILFKSLRYISPIFVMAFGLITIIATGVDDDEEEDNGFIYDDAHVEEIDIIILESFPIQINVVAKGYVPDSCTEIYQVLISKKDNVFFLNITTIRPAEVACAAVIVPFEEVIPLDVYGLEAGLYKVNVNGVTGSFELSVDNIIQE